MIFAKGQCQSATMLTPPIGWTLVSGQFSRRGNAKAFLLDETATRAISRNGCKTSTRHPMETPSPSPRLAYPFCGDLLTVPSSESPSRKSSSGTLCGASETKSIDARPRLHAFRRWRLRSFVLSKREPGRSILPSFVGSHRCAFYLADQSCVIAELVAVDSQSRPKPRTNTTDVRASKRHRIKRLLKTRHIRLSPREIRQVPLHSLELSATADIQ
jgi:hypothetical protein